MSFYNPPSLLIEIYKSLVIRAFNCFALCTPIAAPDIQFRCECEFFLVNLHSDRHLNNHI